MLPRTASHADHEVYELITHDANTPSAPTYWAAHRLLTVMEAGRATVTGQDEYPIRGGITRNYRMSDGTEIEAMMDLDASPIVYRLVSISLPPLRNEPPAPAIGGSRQLDDANVVPHTDQLQSFPYPPTDPVQEHTPITPGEHVELVALIERCWSDPDLDIRTYVGSPGLSPWLILDHATMMGGQTHVSVSPVVNEFLRALAQASYNVGQAEEETIRDTRPDPLATGARKLRL